MGRVFFVFIGACWGSIITTQILANHSAWLSGLTLLSAAWLALALDTGKRSKDANQK